MTDVMTPHTLGEFRVWVIPGLVNASNFFYEFDMGAFRYEPRLIPERLSDRPGGMGTASFRLLRALREENGALINDPGFIDLGGYIAVTKEISDTAFDRTKVVFWGYIGRRDISQLAGGIDKVGTVTARGLGHLLDTIQLSGFKQASTPGGAVSELLSPPTFNLEGDGGTIIGNKTTTEGSIPVFAALPSLCSPTALFSREEVLAHILKYCKPAGIPRMILASAVSGLIEYLQTTTDREIFALKHLTLKGAIDLLIPRSQGLGWQLVPNINEGETRWTVYAYPLLDSVPAAYGTGYPAASPVNVNASEIESDSVTYHEDAADLYDTVTVEGDNILIGATAAFADGNLAKGWTEAQETAYRAGASAATDYEDLSEEEKKARNEEFRNSPLVSDVFSLVTLNLTSATINRSATPGTGAGALPLVPAITWTGTAATVSESLHRTPYLPAARLSRVVPWEIGKKGDGTDDRDAAAKARPEHMKPRVFRYMEEPPEGESICADLLVPTTLGGVSRPSPTVTPDDRTPGLRIAFSPSEYMALNHWNDDANAVSRIGTIEENTRTFDYETLAATLGIPSDQCVRVSIQRAGVADGKERAELIVRDKRLQCWVMLDGSIVGTLADGTADRVSGNVFVRNDFPTAQRMATALAAFAFRKRTSISVTLAEPDNLPAWASIGTMIGQITEAPAVGPAPTVVADAYTVVEAVDYDLTRERPRVTISTTLPSPPSMGGAGSSPTSGGSVSGSLGGTVAQATAQTQDKARDNAGRTASVPTHIGQSPVSVPPYRTVLIDGGNTLETGQQGVVYVEDPGVETVPSAYDPDVTSSFIDGIGRGTLYVNQVAQDGYVLVVCDDRGSFRNCLVASDAVWVGDPVSIPVDGGGSVQAYPVG